MVFSRYMKVQELLSFQHCCLNKLLSFTCIQSIFCIHCDFVDLLNKYLKLNADPDNGLPVLPGQIWGLYIGWAKFDAQKVLKAVINVCWSVGGCYSQRNIVRHSLLMSFYSLYFHKEHTLTPCFAFFQQLFLINENHNDHHHDQKMQLLLVGYLGRSFTAVNKLLFLWL